MVVNTLGPARRRTHGLCVTVRCQWKKKDRLRQQESHNETICIAFAFPFVFIHCFMGSFHAHFHSPFGRCFEFSNWACACACLSCLPACPCLPATAYLDLTASFCLSCPFLCFLVFPGVCVAVANSLFGGRIVYQRRQLVFALAATSQCVP